jgi:hypothetical protein
MIQLIEGHWCLGLIEVLGNSRNRHVDLSVNDFEATFALDIGEDHQDVLDVGVPGSTLASVIIIFVLVPRRILSHL